MHLGLGMRVQLATCSHSFSHPITVAAKSGRASLPTGRKESSCCENASLYLREVVNANKQAKSKLLTQQF